MDASALLVIGLKVLAVLVLVLVNGFFVAAEFALVKVRETQLDVLARKGQRKARTTKRVIGKLDASLSACQLGITMASLALGWVGEPIFSAILAPLWPLVGLDDPAYDHLRHTTAVVVGFSVVTFLHISAGEQAPKWLAIQRPLPVALTVSGPLELFWRVSYPFIWLLNRASLGLVGLLGIRPNGEGEAVYTEEELRLLVASAPRTGGGSRLGREIVLNAMDLRHRIARDVMKPRPEIVGLPTGASIDECVEIAEKTRYSRFPLCEGGDLDRMLGVVHVKDLYALRRTAKRGADLMPAARRIVYVPETARLERLLEMLLERKLHLSIVVDEFGGTVGAVTLEDILEELVGEIQDEFDQEKPTIVEAGEGAYEMDGGVSVHELADLIGQPPLREEGVATVSGLLTLRLGAFPKKDDRVVIGGHELRVLDADAFRASRVRLTRLPEEP